MPRLCPSRAGVFRMVFLCLMLASPAIARAAEAPAAVPPVYALILGGGPDVTNNAAQIEGHARFVAGLLPASAGKAVLFADGQASHASVSHADLGAPANASRALAILLADHDAAEPLLTRPPRLDVPLDGAARLPEFRRALAKLSGRAAKAPAPLLLYFAGHGTRNEANEADTGYDLWGSDLLKVRTLAAELGRVPRTVPVVLVMAQCFSGAFADVLFRGGDPQGVPVDGNVVGFFSARKDREAAGCSYATRREDYQDFSSFFFGALSGRDRFGGTVNGADFDGDGQVSLHEAFCHALIHDPSADTPVCTSDAFLEQFAPLSDAAIYGKPYREVWQTGTAAQRAVLDALSGQLGLTGEGRAVAVFDRLTYGDPAARPDLVKGQNEAKEQLENVRGAALGPLLEYWPDLRWSAEGSREYGAALDGAREEFARNPALCRTLIEAARTHERTTGAVENEEAALQRFAGLYGHLVRADHLRAHGRTEVQARFERLWQAEQRSLPMGEPPSSKGKAADGVSASSGNP